MKNKTIFDAVNEFKGEWPYKTNGMVESKGGRTCYEKGELSDYYCDNPDRLNLVWFNFTCNKKEFNALVDAMSTNFGECRPINVSDYKIVTKTLLKPEPIKQASNTYTQEMANNGVFPSVGMECLINFPDIDDVWYEYTIDFMGNYTFIASCEDVSERFGYVDDVHFKPLTPPVPLIDGKAYQFDMFNGNIEKTGVSGIYSSEDDEFIYLQNVVRPFDCTNIQPLTLD